MGCGVQWPGGYRRHIWWELLRDGSPVRPRVLQWQDADIQGQRPGYRGDRELGEGRRNDIGPLAGLEGFGLLRDGIAAGTRKRRYEMCAPSYLRGVKVLMLLAWLITACASGSSVDEEDKEH